jgi:phosphatidylserine decarboxylase
MKASGKLNGNDMCARKPPAGGISHGSTQPGEVNLRQARRRHQAYDGNEHEAKVSEAHGGRIVEVAATGVRSLLRNRTA